MSRSFLMFLFALANLIADAIFFRCLTPCSDIEQILSCPQKTSISNASLRELFGKSSRSLSQPRNSSIKLSVLLSIHMTGIGFSSSPYKLAMKATTVDALGLFVRFSRSRKPPIDRLPLSTLQRRQSTSASGPPRYGHGESMCLPERSTSRDHVRPRSKVCNAVCRRLRRAHICWHGRHADVYPTAPQRDCG